MHRSPLLHVAVLVGFLLATEVARAQRGPLQLPGGSGSAPTAAKPQWNRSEMVFVATLDTVQAGPVAQSMPPIYMHRLTFTVDEVLRGELKPGSQIVCSHSARQRERPTFPAGQKCLVAASKARGSIKADIVEALTAATLTEVRLSCSLPMGWKLEDGRPVSPWVALGEDAWSGMTDTNTDITCAKTGRPALLAGTAVTFAVESVPPKKSIKWTNPDGDGEYKITVTNPTDKPIAVPALLSHDGKILWEESLVIVSQKKAYPCPGCRNKWPLVEPTTLEAGQSVSTTVNVLRLKGPKWPRGGYRIEFQFCLGEKSQTKSLYYMSRHHDVLRKAVSGK